MAGTILTPAAIWRDFCINASPSAEVISQSKSGSIIYTELNIDGRAVKDGAVKIYARLAKSKTAEISPAILLLADFNRPYRKLQDDLVKNGYIVLAVDIAGFSQDKEGFTKYPESLSYANYEKVKDSLYQIKNDMNGTCWYEWTAVCRYALAYLKNLDGVSKVGGLGMGEACTAMWQVAATDENLDCVCFALNAGWNGYRGIYKYSGEMEPHFSNDMYKFIAGVDPQSYATHVKCPTLMLSATNSDIYDVDRAYDTVNRIDEQLYRAVHYSVGYCNSVSSIAYKNALIFFENALKKKGKITLAKEMDIRCELENGCITLGVIPDKKELESVAVYLSEQTVTPALRAWKKISECKEITKKGERIFEYSPYPRSGMVVAFAEATYKSGFTVCSPMVSKKFSAEDVNAGYKSNIIYSSRIPNAESVFSVVCQNCKDCEQVFIDENCAVKVKKGPMSIDGVNSKCGLMAFKINCVKDKPKQDAILMFDAHAKSDVNVIVKLTVNYFDNPQEFLATVKVFGGKIWHNFKLAINKFKTAEGMPLKSYDKVNAITFLSEDGEFLLNNALWV